MIVSVAKQEISQQRLSVRLARSAQEVVAAQKLRYRVFHDEPGLALKSESTIAMLDSDRFDASCDHLTVVDEARSTDHGPCVVGNYRLLRGGCSCTQVGVQRRDRLLPRVG